MREFFIGVLLICLIFKAIAFLCLAISFLIGKEQIAFCVFSGGCATYTYIIIKILINETKNQTP